MNTELSFGQIVREHRLANNLTQVELANRVGCATVTVRKIEYDRLRPSVQIAERLAMALNIPLEDRANFIRLARTPLEGTPEPAPIPSPPPMPEEIGQEDLSGRAIRGYSLGERIGNGGFGAVYRATQSIVEREVAVKIILPQYADHPDFIRRFEAEAQIIARIEHPFIVPLYDYWREPNAAYLIMRLLRGGSLEGTLKEGPLPLKTAVRYLEQIGTALHAAHRVGIVHRDIKPANILLDHDENSYLADFGIAKNLGNPNLAEQTAAGMMIGSPAYISPEQILAEPIRPQADIYCLGLIFYEMLTGRKPFQGPTPINFIQQHLHQSLPPLGSILKLEAFPPQFEDIIYRATTKKPADRYADVLSMLTEIQLALSQWQSGGSQPHTDVTELIAAENPYKGLYAFGEGDTKNFFGRENMVQELLSRLAESDVPSEGEAQGLGRFLAIIGPSGSGKSSVIKAGLLPALRNGGIPNSERWFIVDMTPGTHPFEELEAALLRIATNPPESLLGQLKEDERGLLRASKRILPQDSTTELLLVIDQFEELFTLLNDETTRTLFLDNLVNAVIDPRSRMRVIITLRADFIDRPLQYVDFGELVRKRTEFTLPLSPDELEQAITRPLERMGMGVEPELLATIIHEISGQSGGLPLLQYALTELFERRDGRLLTLSTYQEIGGVTGALAQRADELYEQLDDTGRAATRQLFLRLITLGEGTGESAAVADTRRRVRLSELTDLGTIAKIERTIEQFGRYRLLTFDHDPATREPTVEVAHEALLREWGRLRAWLDESRDDVRRQRLLARSAAEWLTAAQDDGLLLRGSRLSQFEEWTTKSTIALTSAEESFLAQSLAARQARQTAEETRRQRELETAQQLAETEQQRAAEQAQAAQTLRQRAVYLGVAALVAVLLAITAGIFGQQSTNNAAVAEANAATAVAEGARADIERDAALAAQATSEADAIARATAQAETELERQAAVSAQATAQSEAVIRATAEAEALAQRDIAQEQSELATSRELSQAATSLLDSDPELSMLLALEALDVAYTSNAEDVLHSALQTSRIKHTLYLDAPVAAVHYSPDGTKLIGADYDGALHLWDTSTWETLGKADLDASYYFSYIDDAGKTLSVIFEEADNSGLSLVSWDLVTLEVTQLQTFDIRLPAFTGIALSPDKSLLAISNDNNDAELWDVTTGQKLFTLGNVGDGFGLYDFNMDGSLLAVASSNQDVLIFDVPASIETGTPQLVTAFSGVSDSLLTDIKFIPDGTQLLLQPDTLGTEVWDIADTENPRLDRQLRENFSALAFNIENDLIVGRDFSLAYVWSMSNDATLFSLAGHSSFVNSAIFSPDNQVIATGSADRTIRIWDASVASGGELQSAYIDPGLMDLKLSPNEQLIARGSYFGDAFILDRQSLDVVHRLSGDGQGIYRVSFHPDGSKLATGGVNNVIKIWDVETGQLLQSWKAHEDFGSTGGLFPGILEVEYSPDGSRLASAAADGVAKVWDAETGDELIRFEGHTTPLSQIDYSPDGKMIATGSDGPENTVKIWDAETGDEIYTLNVEDRAWALDFSPDGKYLVTGGTGGFVTLWDMETGQEAYSLPSQRATIANIVFMANGEQFMVNSFGLIRIWDVETGSLVRTISSSFGGWGIALPSDENTVYTSGPDGVIGLFTLNLEETIALAESRVTRGLTDVECQQYLYTETCSQE